MDIWSLGCVALECATGRKPWNSALDNPWAILFQIGQGNHIPQLPEPWQLSATGISFIKSCFTLDPMKRPTAEEMLGHPWMQSLRAELAELENGAESSFQRDSPSHSLNAQQSELARAAQRMEERQMDDIMGSPPDELDAIL